MRARSVGPASKRSCSVGSSAPRMAVIASLTVWTRARKTARAVPSSTPRLRMTCGIGSGSSRQQSRVGPRAAPGSRRRWKLRREGGRDQPPSRSPAARQSLTAPRAPAAAVGMVPWSHLCVWRSPHRHRATPNTRFGAGGRNGDRLRLRVPGGAPSAHRAEHAAALRARPVVGVRRSHADAPTMRDSAAMQGSVDRTRSARRQPLDGHRFGRGQAGREGRALVTASLGLKRP